MTPDTKERIKALIVDDAAFMRRALVEILSSHEDIEVVGVARHGKEALEAVESLDPDVITLDVDMPVMDGLTTIKHLMVRKPRPVIMVSGMADQGRVTFEALKLGAVDFFEKPSGTISLDMKDSTHELGQVVRIAAGLNPGAIKRVRFTGREQNTVSAGTPAQKLLVVFAMDGACGAFIRLMSSLDSNMPVAVTAIQSVSEGVLTSYATEFNRSASWDIHACRGGSLSSGRCYIIGNRGAWHLVPDKEGYSVEPATGDNSADIFLERCAAYYGPDCMAIILGGAINPAPQGLKILQENGGKVLVLAPEASVCGTAARQVLDAGIGEQVAGENELRLSVHRFAKSHTQRVATA